MSLDVMKDEFWDAEIQANKILKQYGDKALEHADRMIEVSKVFLRTDCPEMKAHAPISIKFYEDVYKVLQSINTPTI